MKRKIWLHHLLGALFAFALSASAVGCLATGFDLPVRSMGGLILLCGMISLLCALLFRFKYGGSLLLCLSAIGAFLLWRQEAFHEQFQTLLWIISNQYHMAYGWPAFGTDTAEKVDLALAVLGWWTAASVSFCVCRRKHLLTALPSVVLPLVACLIVTNTVPEERYLYFLILGVALLLLTDWVRRKNPAQSVSLTLRMAIPVAAALGLLFGLNPQERYINHAAELQKEVVTWFQELQNLPENVMSGTDVIGSQKLNLRSVGPKSNLSYAVMRVNSPIDGSLYLRGQDYDTYSGTGWESSQGRSETFTSGGESVGMMTITTYGTRNLLYVPYHIAESVTITDGFVENSGNLTRYSYDLVRTPTGGSSSPDSQAIQLPEDTLFWADTLAREITAGCGTREEMVQTIGDYVRNSATYDLDTSRMSTEYDDFARWFLEESDSGYCVHFATAATVLLRAAGIPARYVEGYMVSTRAGENTVVSSRSAHAWAEYYDEDINVWRVLEATPADANAETEPEASLPTEPVDSEPPETQTDTTSPVESEETQPVGTPVTSEPSRQQASFKLPGWVKTLIKIILVVLAVVLQGELRISRKRRIWNRGNPNEMALKRWKQAEQMARLLKIPLPEELDALAQKASFSQHTLTREELYQFDQFRRDSLRTLHTQPVYRKWFLRWILAVG